MNDFLAAWTCDDRRAAAEAVTWMEAAPAGCESLLVAGERVLAVRGRAPRTVNGCSACGPVRLDDRAALLARLPPSARERSDADQLLTGWAQNGVIALDVAGAFALVAWDARRRQLTVARDHLGLQPVYYAATPGGLLVASSTALLLKHPAVSGDFDERTVLAACVGYTPALVGRTIYAHVHAVPPASLLVAAAPDRHRIERYWRPQTAPAQRTTEQWVEGLRDRVQAAVHSAVRGESAVGTHLSGGLDSTVVAAVAQRELRERGTSLVGAWSWSPSPAARASTRQDERRRVERAAVLLGVPVHWTEVTPAQLAAIRSEPLSSQTLMGAWEGSVLASAEEHGTRVLLSGWGGDEFASFSTRGALAGLLAAGELRAAVAAAVRRAPGRGPRRVWRATRVTAGQARLLLPPGWQRTTSIDGLVRRVAARGYHLHDVHREAETMLAQLSRGTVPGAAATQLALLDAGHLSWRTAGWAERGAAYGIEYRYPLLDRRVVEYALTVPDVVHLAGRNRWMMRDAFADLLGTDLTADLSKPETARVEAMVELFRDTPTTAPGAPEPIATMVSRWWDIARELHIEANVR